jgi:predicted HNH restriction endonuclease
MSSHSECCNESRALCEGLSEKLKQKIVDLKISQSGDCCSFSVTNTRKFIYVYHRKVKKIIEVWCSGNMEELINQSYVEFRPGTTKIKMGWHKNFPGRFILKRNSEIENAVSLLYEISYKGVLNNIKEKALSTKLNAIEPIDIEIPPPRVEVMTTRVIRDTIKTKQLKKKYNYCCQICNEQIKIDTDIYYIEVHHLRPLGGKHSGLDERGNMLVLCPNHHAMFDYGIPYFSSEGEIEIENKFFKLINKHPINKANIDYHNENICRNKK